MAEFAHCGNPGLIASVPSEAGAGACLGFTPAAGVKNAASGGSHGGVIWPSLITAQPRRPTVNR